MEGIKMQTITIRQGDSTDFFYTITAKLRERNNATLDLTGWTAVLQVANHTEKFVNLEQANNEIEIIFDAEATRKMPVGKHKVFLKLITDDERVGTERELFILDVLSETVNAYIV
jgi:hypothetical protein